MKWAVVTGTSRGLGCAVARELVARGWHVQGIARSAAPSDLGPPHYRHLVLDLGRPEELDRALEAEAGGSSEGWLVPHGVSRVGLVNNAAILAPVGPTTGLSARALAQHFAVNVVAPIRLAGALLARAPTPVPLRIVNLSSGAATQPYAGWSAYCAGKAALLQASAVLAAEFRAFAELAGRDLAVVDFAPHVVATEMQAEVRNLDPRLFPGRQRFIDLHRRGGLVAPEGPAARIAGLLEHHDLPPHSTLRYEP